MRTRNVFCVLVVCLASAAASPAAAQTAGSGKWEIEFHGGGMLPTNPTGGTVSLPGPGEVFTSLSNVPAIGPAVHASRRQSSWYFGDGAILFNGLADTLVATGQAAVFQDGSPRSIPYSEGRSAPSGAGGASAPVSAAC